MSPEDQPTVTLSWPEVMEGVLCGGHRRIENLRWGTRSNAPPEVGWQRDIEGGLAEKALAKHLNLYHHGAYVFRAADISGTVQVRGTPRADGCLLVHKPGRGANLDDPNDAFVLVTGCDGTYTIRGWLPGHAAMLPEYWCDRGRNGRPAFFVPQAALQPIRTLVCYLDRPTPGARLIVSSAPSQAASSTLRSTSRVSASEAKPAS